MTTPSGAAAPVFSYAQAAKGFTPSTSSQPTTRNESPAASEKHVRDRPAPESNSASLAPKSPQEKTESEVKVATDVGARTPAFEDSAGKENVSTAQNLSVAPEGSLEQANAPSNEPAQDSRKDEARPQLSNGRTHSSEQISEVSAPDAADRKSKDPDEDWEKVSVPSMTAEKELKAAPIPVVNIWQQRREAQAAKAKEVVGHQRNATSSATHASRPSAGDEDPKRRSMSRDLESHERNGKSGDIARANSRKEAASTRPPRDRIDVEAPPSVADAQAWPTPDSSLVEERRKSTTYEKADHKGNSQTKWKTMPFVPTAKFETQLPPSAARRGGRGGGRGRDLTGRGGHTGTAGEKQDLSGSMGPPPLPKQPSEQDRGRRPEGPRGPRGGSVPTGSTRPENSEDLTPAFRKPSVPFTKERGSTDRGEQRPPKTEQSSRSSSQHTGRVADPTVNGDTSTSADKISGAFGQSSEQNARYPFSFDRFKSTANGSSRGGGEFARERGSGRNRDWSRDKPESAREKVESWRDRESSGDQTTRREPRNERGRGGYRGRGNHSYNPPYNSSHAYTAPLPQNGFEPSRSSSNAESRSRQASQPFQPTQTPNSSRNNPRSQSIPVGMMLPGYYPGVPQGVPALQADMQMYGYPQQMQMQPGIMSAMPYNDPLNSYALLSMVMTQVEYYFSIDNLCKDLFLRKHMDGQGYVPLSIIANFKRIKTLTEDNMTLDTLRYVCQQVKSVEFLPGPDGNDRLRRREGWQDFILPEDERFDSARNDGPEHNVDQYIRSPHYGQTAHFDPSFGVGQIRSPPLNVPTNGIFHPASPMSYIQGSQIDGHGSFVAPFEDIVSEDASRAPYHSVPTPVRSPPSQGGEPMAGLLNGHHRQGSRADIEENVFPDENIPNINIRMQPRPTPDQGDSAVDATNASAATEIEAGNGDLNKGQSHVPSLSLRGGAASPQQLDQFRNFSFGSAATMPVADSVVYVTKDGHETQLPPPQHGQYDQSYQSLHDMAFRQRQLGVDGALEPLYFFWSDFLVDKFNVGMYQEFKSTAVSDFQEGSSGGMKQLVRYYGKVLGGHIPVSERLATDMVTLSREDKDGDRSLFHTLRAAWRNGATHMKTIKRLGDVLTVEEKAELDKSG
nr:hypothetical protein LTR18_008682 [Exophiala xenobiotica]